MTDPPTEEARAVAYAVPSYDDQYCPEGFGQGAGAAVPLDDYGFGFDYRWSRPTSRPPLPQGIGGRSRHPACRFGQVSTAAGAPPGAPVTAYTAPSA